MATVLGMLDEHQGQINGNFCADEVFCGRNPNRGTGNHHPIQLIMLRCGLTWTLLAAQRPAPWSSRWPASSYRSQPSRTRRCTTGWSGW
eukprot:SAG11_NODE_44_length_20765_cov_5.183635_23_plen_89_part_00